jgi:hypothetical protein
MDGGGQRAGGRGVTNAAGCRAPRRGDDLIRAVRIATFDRSGP